MWVVVAVAAADTTEIYIINPMKLSGKKRASFQFTVDASQTW